MGPRPDDRIELNLLAERLGARLRAAEPVGWGDARATLRLSLADDRRFAARRFAGPEPYARVERIGQLMTRLAEAGLPVPLPTIVDTPGARWLLTAWVEGKTGATWLNEPDRARHLADRMGRLASRLRRIDLATADLDGRPAAAPAYAGVIEPVAFVHGDFAPVNVVMREDGEIGALLDFEHASSGPPLLDVAWWGWVIRHHHPEVWTAAWPTFLAAAGLEPGDAEPELHELVLQTLKDRVAVARDADEQARWQQRLSTARTWSVPRDQAT